MPPTNDPTQIGRFTVLHPLGEGGMGKVYLARDTAMDREVALKTITAAGAESPKLRERFLREAKAAGALSHPNLVTVHDFGEADGQLYLVMEYLPGMDLSVYLHQRKLTASEALEVMAQVCDGLAYAHAKGVLHRDVKPTNVRVQRVAGRLHAKLMDFGVAHIPGSSLTATGDLVGTFAYMAPEYLRTGEADARCDLYAVGMMLHEALTGELPAMAPTLPGQALAEGAKRSTLEGVSPRTWEIVEKALAPASRRFDSARDMAAALRAAQDPAWPGLEASDLPMLRSMADAALPPTRPGDAPTAPAMKRTAFQPLLHPPTPQTPSRAWVPLVILLATGGAGLWLWKGRGSVPPAAATPSEPAPREVHPEEARPVAPQPAATPSPSPQPPPVETRPVPPQDLSPRREPEARPRRAVDELLRLEGQIRSRPKDAWEAAQAALREAPEDPVAHAFTVASLYWMDRPQDLARAVEDAKARGVDARPFGAQRVVREMMQQERSQRRLPPQVMDQLKAYLPPPPGERPEGRGERW
jgi:serine/threonine-protein kinase